MASRRPGGSFVFQLLELWKRILRRKQFRMEVGNLQVRESTLCHAQRPVTPHVGSKCSEKLKDWLKGTEPLTRRTSNACWLWPSSHRATLQYWRYSMSMVRLLNHLVILGFEEFSTKQLPHMALSSCVKTSSENIPNSSGFTLPWRICEKNWPSTQPAGTSQWLPLQEMYIIKIECCSMNFIHTCPLGLFIRNNYLCLLSQEHIFYRVH